MAIGQGWVNGAWVDAGWVTGAWVQAGAAKTIGDSSQLEAFSSSGGLDVLTPETIGASSTLGVFTASAALTVVTPKTLGGSTQLSAFTSTGGIQLPEDEVTSTGGGIDRKKKLRARPAIISYEGATDRFLIEEPEIEIEESVAGLDREIERVEKVQKILDAQIISAKDEISLLALKDDLDMQIKHEILQKDVYEAGKFLDSLVLDLLELRGIRKKRRDEEELIAILMMEAGKTSIMIH